MKHQPFFHGFLHDFADGPAVLPGYAVKVGVGCDEDAGV
jgi:hypothetical protein